MYNSQCSIDCQLVPDALPKPPLINTIFKQWLQCKQNINYYSRDFPT